MVRGRVLLQQVQGPELRASQHKVNLGSIKLVWFEDTKIRSPVSASVRYVWSNRTHSYKMPATGSAVIRRHEEPNNPPR